jgi:hypothetical protein
MEIGRAGRSAAEIQGLWDYVGRRLEKLTPVAIADLDPALPSELEWPATASASIG